MQSEEIRQLFLEFFEKKGHKILPSASLIPDDPQLMFTVAGMVPFKPIFWGKVDPIYTRIATCQKCIRTTDIENVGRTPRHHTFFEMLGNFSFGDYFKREAIEWAWEFITQVLKMPEEKLWISVYEKDDEAYEIWRNIGIPSQKILRLGKEDNFWGPAGPTGPCGPDTEIFYDTGMEVETVDGKEPNPANTEGRFVEIWNLVFTEYYQDENGNLLPLKRRNIDTGAGLERIAAMMQGVYYNFDTDLFLPIINRISDILKVDYAKDQKKDVSIRVIADHIRALIFLISDGVFPSNEGRGYVLRRILRRAARHGKLLGADRPFLYNVVDAVVEKMGKIYPEIVEKSNFVKKIIHGEEERFLQNLNKGLEIVEKVVRESGGKIDGKSAFKLYDTYGFPLDILKDLANENGYVLDEEGFNKYMEEQRKKARNAAGEVEFSERTEYESLNFHTEFVGYDTLETDVKVLKIKTDDFVDSVENVECELVFDVTPFYPEKGGQVSDKGVISFENGNFEVKHVYLPVEGIIVHKGVLKGRVKVGDKGVARVDMDKRKATARNHTATHLLHAALRKILGTHVRQAGSSVEPERLRFDFTHYEALTEKQIKEVEKLVNEIILEAIDVKTEIMSYDEAVSKGAMALFEEKYGDKVRVVKVADFSEELCGGTHVKNTGEIGLFKIISEGSVSAGVRRIEAITGMVSLSYLKSLENNWKKIKNLLEANDRDVFVKIEKLKTDIKSLESKFKKFQKNMVNVEKLLEEVNLESNIKYLVKEFEGLEVETLREISDRIIDKGVDLVVFFNKQKDKVVLIVKRRKDLKKLHAGEIAKTLSKVLGGGGGGRPDFAQAGGKEVSKISDAKKKLVEILKEC
ncbi:MULTISPECIES: alanine--tRNA ligase [unclassified Thermosipho (in: thermotogales)]|uniref:alanine--tRNA ligase n=1 Tax=unclassified Thermosipho (in: thermotogales) TaxID=2676525 RepID=UPI000986512C|nr:MULTISPECIES: alanine--tRNA ligase [unclassified Thermosipho (in: thermotogales)]MBT1247560.1 alanine--tRNA ligase [Thermosipho sp. 1244]OOC46200.1 alanyl-tRNA synthetase [Thermosipho sp. 1223]